MLVAGVDAVCQGRNVGGGNKFVISLFAFFFFHSFIHHFLILFLRPLLFDQTFLSYLSCFVLCKSLFLLYSSSPFPLPRRCQRVASPSSAYLFGRRARASRVSTVAKCDPCMLLLLTLFLSLSLSPFLFHSAITSFSFNFSFSFFNLFTLSFFLRGGFSFCINRLDVVWGCSGEAQSRSLPPPFCETECGDRDGIMSEKERWERKKTREYH